MGQVPQSHVTHYAVMGWRPVLILACFSNVFASGRVISPCKSGQGIYYAEGKKCFFRDPGSTTWSDSFQDCKHHGGTLATVHDQKTHDFISAKYNVSGQYQYIRKNQYFWIGLHNKKELDKPDVWEWADGTSLSVNLSVLWDAVQPNITGDCVAYVGHAYLYWHAMNCNRSLESLCEIKDDPPPPVVICGYAFRTVGASFLGVIVILCMIPQVIKCVRPCCKYCPACKCCKCCKRCKYCKCSKCCQQKSGKDGATGDSQDGDDDEGSGSGSGSFYSFSDEDSEDSDEETQEEQKKETNKPISTLVEDIKVEEDEDVFLDPLPYAAGDEFITSL